MKGKIEIYSNNRKNLRFVPLLIILIVMGIVCFLFFNTNSLTSLFFSILILISCTLLLLILFLSKKKILLVIDQEGIIYDPTKSNLHFGWSHIAGFSSKRMGGSLLILVNLKKPRYWINKETKKYRKRLLEVSLDRYGTPYGFLASSLKIDKEKLLDLLNSHLEKYNEENEAPISQV